MYVLRSQKKVILFVICTCTMITIVGFRRPDSTEPSFSKELWQRYLVHVFLEIRSKVWPNFYCSKTLFVDQSTLSVLMFGVGYFWL